jgi:hypothetical protein
MLVLTFGSIAAVANVPAAKLVPPPESEPRHEQENMRRGTFLPLAISAFILSCILGYAQSPRLRTTVSPKLRRFLYENPKASITLSNTLRDTFGERTVVVYYFYSDASGEARAFHSYPDHSTVSIWVMEDQLAIDEFICLVFEAINSKSQTQFQELFRQAEAGTLDKETFSKRVLILEFQAVKQVRDILRNTAIDAKGSYYYERFVGCPENFDDFVAYVKSVSKGVDPLSTYESQYEAMRKIPTAAAQQKTP